MSETQYHVMLVGGPSDGREWIVPGLREGDLIFVPRRDPVPLTPPRLETIPKPPGPHEYRLERDFSGWIARFVR